MAYHKTSMDALRKLLFFPSNLSHNRCSITKIPQYVTKLSNGFEYCLIEITCDNSIQYGLQAFREEAMKLHKEAIWYQMYSLQKENEKREEKKEYREQGETPFVYSSN
jgi:hypothetical protein